MIWKMVTTVSTTSRGTLQLTQTVSAHALGSPARTQWRAVRTRLGMVAGMPPTSCPGSAHSTRQLLSDSRVDRSWERVYHRGCPGPRWHHSLLNSCSHNTLTPNPAYFTPQPCTRQSQQRKGCDPGLLLRECMAVLQVHRADCMDFTCFQQPLWGRAHSRATKPGSILTLVASTPTTGSRPCLVSHGAERRPTLSPKAGLDTPHHQPQFHQGGQHTQERCGWHPRPQNSPHTSIGHTLSRNAFLRPQ